MSTADMTRKERWSYFAYHGAIVEDARADFLALLALGARRYGKVLEDCGAFEKSHMNADRFVGDLMDAVDGPLSDEWKEYLGL